MANGRQQTKHTTTLINTTVILASPKNLGKISVKDCVWCTLLVERTLLAHGLRHHIYWHMTSRRSTTISLKLRWRIGLFSIACNR